MCEPDYGFGVSGSEGKPNVLIVLCHGINVLSDDLYGLAYHTLKVRRRKGEEEGEEGERGRRERAVGLSL